MLALLIIVCAFVLINNIIAKFWKPVKVFTADSWHINPPIRYATPEELNRIAPHMGEDFTVKKDDTLKEKK